MTLVTNSSKLTQVIQENNLLLLYFSGKNCAVCKVLKPKIQALFSEEFPLVKLIEIPTETALDITAQLGVFSLPTVLLFVEQKEFLRKGRNVSLTLLSNEVKRVYTLFLQKD